MKVRNADFERDVRASFAQQAFMAHLGARLARVEPGVVEIHVDFRDDLTQQDGFIHAGVTGAIADSAGGYAAMTLMAPDTRVLSVEYKLNLLSPAVGERLEATARIMRAGRTLTVAAIDVDAVNGDERKRCATMLQTLIAIEAERAQV